MPRLRQFTEAYPEIDLALQVSIPLLDVVAEDADLMVRFGTGHYADVEHVACARDVVTPLASPAWVREHGPFERPDRPGGPPCCAARWSPGAPGLPRTAWTGRSQRRLAVQRHRPDVRRRRAGMGVAWCA
jgi:LysR family glycine cleavage system transcriptional activator